MSSRREWMKQAGGAAFGAAALSASTAASSHAVSKASGATKSPAASELHGKIKQSASRWCYQRMPLPELCRNARRIGLVGTIGHGGLLPI